MEKTRVFIVDENSLFRDGLCAALSQQDIEVIGQSGDAEESFSAVKALMPNVVIADAIMALSSPELAARIRRFRPITAVIVLTTYDDDEELYLAIRAGVAAYLTKRSSAQELVAAIKRVAAGEYLINESLMTRPKIASRVLEQFQNFSVAMGKELDGLVVPLSAREKEILEYIAHGNSNKQIAHHLGLKEQSVKNYVTAILRKLAANDRAHAVFIALQRGWIASK